MLTFRTVVTGSDEYRSALQLRDEILRQPLGLSLFDEDLSVEVDYLHLVGCDAHGVVHAYLHLRPYGAGVLKMQQVAVAEPLRGRGIGREMVRVSEELAHEHGARQIVLHAREEVVSFYESLGYRIVGERFIEIGVPHFKAEKPL